MGLFSEAHITVKGCGSISDRNYKAVTGEYKLIIELIRDSLHNVEAHTAYWKDSLLFLKDTNGQLSYFLDCLPDKVAKEILTRINATLKTKYNV